MGQTLFGFHPPSYSLLRLSAVTMQLMGGIDPLYIGSGRPIMKTEDFNADSLGMTFAKVWILLFGHRERFFPALVLLPIEVSIEQVQIGLSWSPASGWL